MECRGYPVGRPLICPMGYNVSISIYILAGLFTPFRGEAPPLPYRSVDYQYPMQMIRHDNDLIQFNI